MQAHDVSPLVNKPEYDSAQCIKPADPPIARPVAENTRVSLYTIAILTAFDLQAR
jgi:hypothetical protein